MVGKLENLASRGHSDLVLIFPAKFERCASKIVGGVGFFSVTKYYCQFSHDSHQFDDTDFKVIEHANNYPSILH